MSVKLNYKFYFEILPYEFRINKSSVARSIHRFLSKTYAIKTVTGHEQWTVYFTRPEHETLFRLKYSDYVQ